MSDFNIFISYSHKDDVLVHKLESHLAVLKKQNLITNWYDRDINAGEAWSFEIDKHLKDAQIILLLISPNFLESDYSYSSAMKYAMMRHKSGEASVIPIILRPVDWLGTTPFGKLQALPTGGKPIALWKNSEDAFLNITQGLRRVIYTMKLKSPDIQSTQIEGQIIAKNESVTTSSQNVTSINTTKESSSIERLDYLEQLIHRYNSSMRDLESDMQLADDLREKQQIQKSIEHQRLVVKDFLDEYMELTDESGTIVPKDIIQISAQLSDTGDTSSTNYDNIRQVLSTLSLRDLRLLGLDLGVDVDIFPGDDVATKINPLLDYMRQRSRMDDLKAYLKRKRPSLMIN